MPADPFDIKLTIDPAGTPTEIGLMLVKPEKQPKQYLITELDPPDQHLDWVQRDFRGGMVGDKPVRSETNQYASGENFLAEPQSGHLFSGPDFKEASTVGSADLTVFGGIVHRDGAAGHYAFIINNNDAYRSDNDGDVFALSKDPAATPLSIASWGDYLLMAINGAGYWYSTDDGDAGDGSDWTQSTLAVGSQQDYFIPAGDVLWGLKGPDSLRWCTDPSNSGEWSGETLVGEDTNDGFVGGFFISQVLVVVKNSGVYVVDDGGNVEKVVNVKNIRGACTDYTSRVFFYDIQDNVWLYDIFGQEPLRNLNFGEAVPGNPQIGGNIGGGIAWADGKVFVSPSKAIYQWSQFYDNTGRLLAEGWESLYKDSGLAATQGCVFPAHELLVGSRITFPVYFGGSATATKMGYVRARRTGDWSDTANIDYSAVDSVITSGLIDHDQPTTRKLYQFVEVDLDGVDLKARVAYSIDGGTWTNLGAANIATTGKTLVEFPAGSDGYTVQIRITNDPVDNADYIEVKSWRIHATLQPSYRRLVKIAARIADGLTLRDSARHPQRGDTLKTNLVTARTTGARLQLEDYFGNDFDVVILAPFVEVPSRDEKASDTESEIHFAAVEYGVGTAT